MGSMSKATHYDYIVVGGGSAGCVLANRLSASGQHQVLLLEAGDDDRHPFIHVPGLSVKAMKRPNHTHRPLRVKGGQKVTAIANNPTTAADPMTMNQQ